MKNLDKIIENIKSKVSVSKGSIGVIIGTCFADFLDEIENKVVIPFSEIPNLNVFGKDKQDCKFIFGSLHGKNVIILHGRIHYCLGYSNQDIATPIYLLKELGCEKLILCASVGAISKKIKVGDIVTFTDQINLTSRNPLNGITEERYGHRFIDMINPYDEEMIAILKDVAKNEMSIKVKEGVVIEFPGPSAETISESKFALQVGADIIAFNICNEVIAAKYCSLPIAVYGLVTNYASAFTNSKIKHEDIVYNRKCASNYYLGLLSKYILNL